MTIFSDQAAIVAELKADRLALLSGTYLSGITLPDDYIYSQIIAAEADASRQLRVHFEPTVIIPDDAPQSEIDALEDAETRYDQEPAYDYDPEFFRGERWGYLVTQNKPIISVQSMRFAYPAPAGQVFDVPPEWIRLDRKFGHIRLVPAAQSFSAPLSAWIMQALGGGRTIPFMIQLRYTAGLKNASVDYPDLVSLIKKMAVLRIIGDKFQPQSESISGDGLSQSFSADVAKYQGTVDHMIDTLRQSIHGIRMMVV